MVSQKDRNIDATTALAQRELFKMHVNMNIYMN